MADLVSDDLVEYPAASDVVAWWDVSGSMVARGVAEMMARIKDEEDEASLWRKKKSGQQ
jgi:hypothetical protein